MLPTQNIIEVEISHSYHSFICLLGGQMEVWVDTYYIDFWRNLLKVFFEGEETDKLYLIF